jgi:hypothetical protein
MHDVFAKLYGSQTDEPPHIPEPVHGCAQNWLALSSITQHDDPAHGLMVQQTLLP